MGGAILGLLILIGIINNNIVIIIVNNIILSFLNILIPPIIYLYIHSILLWLPFYNKNIVI